MIRIAALLGVGLVACADDGQRAKDEALPCVNADPGDGRYALERNADSAAVLYWARAAADCVPIYSARAGTDQLSNEVNALIRSVDVWNAAFGRCGPLPVCLEYAGPLDDAAGYGLDRTRPYLNLVTYVGERAVWDARHRDTLPTPPVALTTLFSTADGEIFDADVEVNTAYYRFSTNGAPQTMDLQSVLTHELGHVLGFDHVAVSGSVMQPRLDLGARRRALGPGDLEGTCAVFACYGPGD